MYRILIVDDDKSVRQTIRSVLEASGLAVDLFEAEDGLEGFELAKTLQTVDLFIVDFNMPKLNGLQVCERLLEIDAFKGKPIMLYTTETNPDLVKSARALSPAIKWVIKPLAAEPFVQAIKGCLGIAVAHIYSA